MSLFGSMPPAWPVAHPQVVGATGEGHGAAFLPLAFLASRAALNRVLYRHGLPGPLFLSPPRCTGRLGWEAGQDIGTGWLFG
jgi:hypothetical protein